MKINTFKSVTTTYKKLEISLKKQSCKNRNKSPEWGNKRYRTYDTTPSKELLEALRQQKAFQKAEGAIGFMMSLRNNISNSKNRWINSKEARKIQIVINY